MRTSLRRTIALAGLTAVVVVSGSIAVADGSAVQDITDRALRTAPAAADLDAADPSVVAEGADTTESIESPGLRAAANEQPTTAPRRRSAPDRGDRVAEESGWIGRASWYGPNFHGKRTANGEVYDQWGMTAAHKTLPFGTMLRVTNTSNGRSVVVRINDRGPFIEGRDLDLSRAAAEELGYAGVATVRVQNLTEATT